MCDHDQSNVLAWKRRSHGPFFYCCASSPGQRGGNGPLMEPQRRGPVPSSLFRPEVGDSGGGFFSGFPRASAAFTATKARQRGFGPSERFLSPPGTIPPFCASRPTSARLTPRLCEEGLVFAEAVGAEAIIFHAGPASSCSTLNPQQ